MRPVIRLTIAMTIAATGAAGQSPARVDYALHVDSAAAPGIIVAMRIHGAPAAFNLAMVAHPEYDDQYWRYLTDLRGESANGAVRVTREDSSLWHVETPAAASPFTTACGSPRRRPGNDRRGRRFSSGVAASSGARIPFYM